MLNFHTIRKRLSYTIRREDWTVGVRVNTKLVCAVPLFCKIFTRINRFYEEIIKRYFLTIKSNVDVSPYIFRGVITVNNSLVNYRFITHYFF